MPLTPPSYRHDPAAQTPTPSSHSFQYTGPLTSMKPFTSAARRKPHPLAQVSMMNSAETDDEDELDLGLSRTLDLGLSKKGRNGAAAAARARLSLDGSQDEGSLDDRLADLDGHFDLDGREYDSALSDDQSLHIGLSEPGMARSGVALGARLSDRPDDDIDASFPADPADFSRDLSALDIPISPERGRPGAPTPNQASRRDENFNNISSTPASGFEGMARQLRKDFERITGLPSPSQSNADRRRRQQRKSPVRAAAKTSNGTLRGLDVGGDRAKRVFGTDLGNLGAGTGLRAGPSRPAAQKAKKATIAGLAQALHRNAPAPAPARKVEPTRAPPPQVIVEEDEEDDEPTPRPPRHHHQRPAAATAPRTPEFGPRSGLLPDSARKLVGGDVSAVNVPDVTGLTDGLTSPDKARPAVSNGRRSASGRVSNEPDPALTSALHELKARLDGLEAENEHSENKVKRLQRQLQHGQHVLPSETVEHDHKSVRSLKGEVARLSTLINSHSHALDSLKNFQDAAGELFDDVDAVRHDVSSWRDQVDVLRGGLEQVADEVAEVRGLVEGMLGTRADGHQPLHSTVAPRDRRQARVETDVETDVDDAHPPPPPPAQRRAQQEQRPTKPQTTRASRAGVQDDVRQWQRQVRQVSEGSEHSARSFIEPDEIDRLRADVAEEEARRLRAAQRPSRPHHHARPTAAAGPVATQGRTVSDDLRRAEGILKSVPKSGHDAFRCSECRRRKRHAETAGQLADAVAVAGGVKAAAAAGDGEKKVEDRRQKRREEQRQGVPPQTVLARVLGELEDDFSHHRAIFIELSEEYKKMDPATSQVARRRALAEHLKESVDLLEQKADHIKKLYDLLHFRDVPALPGGDAAWDAARAAGVCV